MGKGTLGLFQQGEASPTIAQILDRIVEYTYGGMASYRDFIDEVMPLLRTGGLSAPGPRSGSMRRRIVGHDDDRLPQRHPGAAYRETHGRDR